MRRVRIAEGWARNTLLALAAVVAVAGAIWAAQGAGAPDRPAPMAAMLPQGALLSIASPDFGALLREWERSPEQAAWMKSDNYAMFSRSRLFGRLSDAQTQFAAAAGVAPDQAFLDEIAGTDSIFAWYDIGKLEFLYITRLAPGKAEQTRLLQSKSSFSQRQVGSATFYVRTRGAGEGDDQGGEPRTVAFAVSGDYLLLATREDLMAHALGLIGHTSNDSLATEPWFVDVGKAGAGAAQPAAGAAQAPVLRMALDLDRIVKTPYFRSYWVERNVTEMKQYRAALVDLYREPAQMREERVLLPRAAEEAGAAQAELGGLVALVPPGAGVYRAVATDDAEAAVTAVDEKLLRRGVSGYTDARFAPAADLEEKDAGEQDAGEQDAGEQGAGSASDLGTNELEIRIDAPPRVVVKPEEQMQVLRGQFAAAGVTGVLTVDSNVAGEVETRGAGAAVWVPFHSAVVVRAAKAWDEAALESALREALGPQLSAGGLGLEWSRVEGQGGGSVSLGEVRGLRMAVRGELLLLSDDAAMMEAMLAGVGSRVGSAGTAGGSPATLVAGFDRDAVAGPFARLSGLIDRVDAGGGARQVGETAGNAPAFFSGNLAGLSGTFAAMQSERVVERRDGAVTRQTVTYAWRR